MVVVGGKQPWLSVDSQIPDFLEQGIGIFDLSAMEWRDQYDAAAAPYASPDVVKVWYNEHGQYPSVWSNDTVKAWFTGAARSHHRKIGPIVGGVVAVVLGLLLLGLVAYFFMARRSKKPDGRFLRRRRSTKLEELSKGGFQKAELDTNGALVYPPGSEKSELDTTGAVAHRYTSQRSNLDATGGVAYHSGTNPAELSARRQPMEKDGWQVHEAPASQKYELP